MRRAPTPPLRGSLRVLVAAALGAASLAVACSSIIGFESEYEVVAPDAGPDVGTGATSGEGGVPQVGGSGGAGGSAGGGEACLHDPCKGGPALAVGCDPCVDAVCEADPYCCAMTGGWDTTCVDIAEQVCSIDCCGEGTCMGSSNSCTTCAEDCGTCSCPHSVCEVGDALSETDCRTACTGPICGQMASCCGAFGWSIDCYNLAEAQCEADPCVATVCNQMGSCCSTGWTQDCVDLAKTECMLDCDCPHDICTAGEKLISGCDPCVTAVCDVDVFCCNNEWDPYCVAEVQVICDIACPSAL